MRPVLGHLTHAVVTQIGTSHWEGLPTDVALHALDTFINYMGCALGGSQHDAVSRALGALCTNQESSSSVVIGHSTRTTAPISALLNCISGSVYAFDDSHAEAVVHSSSVIGSALIGLTDAMSMKVSGKHFLVSFVWGIELMCRLSKALSVTPAQADIGWSQSGVTGAVGAAAACSKLLRLDPAQTASAIGTAASLSAGLRAAHGTMTMHLVPAHAASLGVQAALLAQAGFTGPLNGLEASHGYLAIFSAAYHAPSLLGELGLRFELLSNTFKAYPCGVVIHALIDACLTIYARDRSVGDRVSTVELMVPPSTAALADRPRPLNVFEAQVSAQHWAAVVLLQGRAGIPQGTQSAIDDTRVHSLRARCRVAVLSDMAVGTGAVRAVLTDGSVMQCHIENFTGSAAHPMDHHAIENKFLNQSVPVLGDEAARQLLSNCRSMVHLDDTRSIWSGLAKRTTPSLLNGKTSSISIQP
jgi:2-methylcitrate dehydratase PrpD